MPKLWATRLIAYVLGALLLLACEPESSITQVPAFVKTPQLSATPNTLAPLAAIVEFETDQPVNVVYTISDGHRQWRAAIHQPATASIPVSYRQKHRDALLKFKPNTRHTISIRIENAFGQFKNLSHPLVFTTKPVSNSFPAITADLVNEKNNDITLFSAVAQNGESSPLAWLIGVDNAGDIIWYLKTNIAWSTIEHLPSGNLRLSNGTGSALEVDLLGNTVGAWRGEKHYSAEQYFRKEGLEPVILTVDGIHQRPVSLKSGNSLRLAYESRRLKGVALDKTNGGLRDAQLVGDVIVELAPNGKELQQLYLLDILDPARAGRGNLPVLHDLYPRDDTGIALDWSHASGLAYSDASSTILLTVPHQQALVAVGRNAGELKWILSSNRNWREPWLSNVLKADFSFDNYLGAPYFLDDTKVLVLVKTERGKHRMVTVRIDQKNMTAKLRWAYGTDLLEPQKIQYLPISHSVLVTSATATGNIISEMALHDNTGNPVKVVKAITSLTVGLGQAWSVIDAIRVPFLSPPALDAVVQNLHAGTTALDDKSNFSLSRVKREVVSQIEEQSLLGEWQIEIDTLGGIQKKVLSIDKQTTSVALGYLDDYPVIVSMRGARVSFTARTQGVSGTAKWRYQGFLDVNGELEGRMSIRHGKEILAAGVSWRASKR